MQNFETSDKLPARIFSFLQSHLSDSCRFCIHYFGWTIDEFIIFMFFPIRVFSQDEPAPLDPQNLSMYKYMDRYNAKSSFESVNSNCHGFVCKKSGLIEISIVVLIQRENSNRNNFANVEQLSNMYSVKWNSDFAKMARQKAMLCLPATTPDQTIYDTTMLKELPYMKALNDSRTQKAVEVVIGVNTRPIGGQPVQNIYADMENGMSNFFDQETFSHPDALLRRGNTLHMGCDYLVRNNDTHVIATMVCVFGLLYFSGYHNNYKPLKGQTCSDCADFYDRHPALATYSSSLAQRWACDLLYPYLCRDTTDINSTSESSHLFPCDGESVEKTTKSAVTFAFFTVPPDVENYVTPKPGYQWPCYHFSVPLILLTLIVLIIIIYNIFTILSLRKKRKNKANV